jgi:hypothetical protein
MSITKAVGRCTLLALIAYLFAKARWSFARKRPPLLSRLWSQLVS